MVARILLTGASGFVGAYLRPALAARWPEAVIIGLGAKTTESGILGPETTGPRTKAAGENATGPSIGAAGPPTNAAGPPIGAVDLLDVDAVATVVRTEKPDLVIHLAAQSSVALSRAPGPAILGGNPTWTVNLSGTLNLAMAVAAHAPDATVLFASTAEVYGASFLGGPVHEASPALPMNAYATSKWIAEQTMAAVLPARTRLIVARPFNHTGPGQRALFVLPSFAAQVARIEAGLQPPMLAVGNLDVWRDFLDVRDVVAAYVALAAAAPRLPPRFLCNIASGTPRRLADLLDILRRLARVPFTITIDPDRLRPVDLPIATANPDLLRAITGWTPTIKIETTLETILEAARQDVAR